jgi:hypothetical protein
MSDAGRRKVIDSPTEAIYAGVDAFETYKERFVAILRDGWERG